MLDSPEANTEDRRIKKIPRPLYAPLIQVLKKKEHVPQQVLKKKEHFPQLHHHDSCMQSLIRSESDLFFLFKPLLTKILVLAWYDGNDESRKKSKPIIAICN